MSKRFTDTTKWQNPWFRKLPQTYKLLFLYMLDSCDNVGVMHLDLGLISFTLGQDVSVEGIKEHLGEKIFFLSEDKIIVKAFLAYQNNLNSPKMHKHIEGLLKKHKIHERYMSGEFN